MKETSNYIILGGGIAFIVILVSVIYFFSRVTPAETDFDALYERTIRGEESEINYMYNNFVFVQTGLFWETLVRKESRDLQGTVVANEFQISSYYSPREVEDIVFNVTTDLSEFNKMYFSYSPNLDGTITLAGVEVGKVVGPRYGILNIPVTQALYSEYDGAAFPVITCDNATADVGVVEFRLGLENSVLQENGCVVLTGMTSRDVLRASNRFIFYLLGIMP